MTKVIRSISLLTLLLASCTLSIAADEPEGQNAAPLYEAIWDGYLGNSKLAIEIHNELALMFDADWEPSPVIQSECENNERMALITAAARSDYCDFNLDYSLGPNLLKPHYTTVYCSQILLIADARIHMREGDYDAGVARLVDALSIAQNSLSDQYIYAAKARIQVVRLVIQSFRDFPDKELTRKRLKPLIHALEWVRLPDPFGLRLCIQQKQKRTSDWIANSWGNREKMLDVLKTTAEFSKHRGVKYEADDFGVLISIEQFGGFDRSIEQYELADSTLLASFDDTDYKDQQNSLFDRVKQNEYGPFARAFSPHIVELLTAEITTVGKINFLREFWLGLDKPENPPA